MMSHKVLQLISSSGFFGAENVLLELSAELRNQGCSVTVGIFRNTRNPNSELAVRARERSLPVEVFECAGRMDLRTVSKIASFVRENSIDIVHSHGYKSNVYAVLSNLVNRRPLVTTCHNWVDMNVKMSLYSRIDRLFLKRFDAVASVSQTVMQTLIKSGVDREKVVLIENGIDVSRFEKQGSPGLRKELGIGPGLKVVGTVGRLTEEKGHTFFLRMAKEVLRDHGHCRFLIIGDGPLRPRLEEEAKSLGISERVIFAGKKNNIPELLSIMDIFVLPSLTEGQPMALFEAMAAGKGIVATDVGDVAKILKNGELGAIVPSGDPAALAKSLIGLICAQEETNAMGLRAHDEVFRKYSSSRMASDYAAVYKRLHRGQ